MSARIMIFSILVNLLKIYWAIDKLFRNSKMEIRERKKKSLITSMRNKKNYSYIELTSQMIKLKAYMSYLNMKCSLFQALHLIKTRVMIFLKVI